ncbi:MAG: low molecular weight phosphotyrosine protein phosphatase [Proteobacteria bacterium]|nr:low molecular weight phosphotyrosine protein phosphatase [Pseudomonadota bacterium]
MNAQSPLRIIFVCTGNICRSPIAEGIFRARLVEAGMDQRAVIDSAGMHAMVGQPPEPYAIELAQEYGADISTLQARQFELEDFKKFDHFIAMDFGHLDYLQATHPVESTLNISLLLDDVGGFKKLEVPDPYRRDRGEYEFSARLINIGVGRLIEQLC